MNSVLMKTGLFALEKFPSFFRYIKLAENTANQYNAWISLYSTTSERLIRFRVVAAYHR